jgi:hypothetical protein
VVSPTDASSAKSAVMNAVHRFLTLKAAMTPRFRVERSTYLPHDVYASWEVGDLRRRRAVLRMNTTRTVQWRPSPAAAMTSGDGAQRCKDPQKIREDDLDCGLQKVLGRPGGPG